MYLEHIENKNKRKAILYRERLTKLESTQNMAIAMLGVKTNY